MTTEINQVNFPSMRLASTGLVACFLALVLLTASRGSAAVWGKLWAGSNGDVFAIDPDTGHQELLLDVSDTPGISRQLGDFAFDPDSRQVYGVSGGSLFRTPVTMFTIDPYAAELEATLLGTLELPHTSGKQVTGLAFTDGTLYAVENNALDDHLFSIDPLTLAIGDVYAMPRPANYNVTDLAVGGRPGELYALQAMGEVYRVDPSAEQLMQVGQVDNTGFAYGLATMPRAGRMFFADVNLSEIDPAADQILRRVNDYGANALEYVPPPSTAVAARNVFYNNSNFDDSNEQAIAVDKMPLLPGQTATFENYTSYSRGINGVMIDVFSLAVPEQLDAAHIGEYFRFRVGNNDDPQTWDEAPAVQTVTTRLHEGVDSSDRITITFEDRAIMNQWLEVTVLATEHTGLDEEDVFYFGNAVGESGNGDGNALVDVSDLLLARNNPRTFLDPAAIDDPFDYNRDQRVDVTDVLLARNNSTSFLTGLRLIAVPERDGAAGATVVAEPSSLAVLLAGLLGLGLCRLIRRRR